MKHASLTGLTLTFAGEGQHTNKIGETYRTFIWRGSKCLDCSEPFEFFQRALTDQPSVDLGHLIRRCPDCRAARAKGAAA